MHTLNKELYKSIITRSFKTKRRDIQKTNKLRKTKCCYCKYLNVKYIIQDNKKVWKDVKLLFFNKDSINNRITLVEDNVILSDSAKCVEIWNNIFSDAAYQCFRLFRSHCKCNHIIYNLILFTF